MCDTGKENSVNDTFYAFVLWIKMKVFAGRPELSLDSNSQIEKINLLPITFFWNVLELTSIYDWKRQHLSKKAWFFFIYKTETCCFD